MVQQDEVGRRRAAVVAGETALGIELGSTRIKACLVDAEGTPLASGSATCEGPVGWPTLVISSNSVSEAELVR